MFRYLSAITITVILGLSIVSSATPAVSMAMATQSVHPTKMSAPVATVAPGGITGIARVARLRVRDAASLRTKVLFVLTRGQSVKILGVTSNKHWFKIETADNKIGWASVYYIRLVGGTLRQVTVIQ